MYIVQSYFVAVLFCILTMFCWGSWANTQKLASKKWPFQLFYWDYSIGILLFTLFMGFTLGSTGSEGRPFLDDIQQAQMAYVGYAILGGIIFNFANLLLVIAIDIAGMAIAFPIGIGIALVLGVVTNYVANPEGNPYALALGVLFVTIAIIIDAIAYRQISKSDQSNSSKGIFISVLAGVAMGFFYKYVAQSMVSDFSFPETGKLTPYTALFFFAGGIFLSNFLFNTLNMYKPISGTPTTFTDYFKLGDSKLHAIGIFGGLIWAAGMSLNILSSEQAGPAIAYGLGQGATMVAAFWGVFIWKEFHALPHNKRFLLYGMFFFFLVGLGVIVSAKIV